MAWSPACRAAIRIVDRTWCQWSPGYPGIGSPAVTVGKPNEALMSAGPKINVSARSDAPAMWWMFRRPVAVSIWSSRPIRFSRPEVSSIIRRRLSTKFTSEACSTLGTMTQSRYCPALPTTSWRSPAHHLVYTPFTRTTTVLPSQVPSFRAWTTLPRASSLASGATESSRSMNTSSAGSPGALESILGLEPGTERHERRGLVVRVGMWSLLVGAGPILSGAGCHPPGSALWWLFLARSPRPQVRQSPGPAWRRGRGRGRRRRSLLVDLLRRPFPFALLGRPDILRCGFGGGRRLRDGLFGRRGLLRRAGLLGGLGLFGTGRFGGLGLFGAGRLAGLGLLRRLGRLHGDALIRGGLGGGLPPPR